MADIDELINMSDNTGLTPHLRRLLFRFQANLRDPKIKGCSHFRVKVNYKPKDDVIADLDQEKQEDEVGETRDDHIGEENLLNDPKIGTGLEIRGKVDENPEKRVLNKIILKIKNAREISVPEDSNERERPLKKTKTCMEFEQVTPNYMRIPMELQSPVSSKVLNNTYSLMQKITWGGKEITRSEEEMNECEDHMYEVDMLMASLRSGVESVRRVMKGEMRLEDLGVKFYRCIEMLYGEEMFEIVTTNHQRALPVILNRLNQKLLEVMAAKERWENLSGSKFLKNIVQRKRRRKEQSESSIRLQSGEANR